MLLSWQNTAGIEDNFDYLLVFRDLGVKKMQLTYSTQNYSAAGHTEENDSGLIGFGKEVVLEMARGGIVCDLSHVGPKITKDVIEFAMEGKPPCFSHLLPAGLKEHKRNKSHEVIRLLGAKGGFVGLSQFGPHMKKGDDGLIDDYIDAVGYLIGLIGETLVAIGSDASEGHARPGAFLEWCNKDKVYARQLTPWGIDKVVKPLRKLEDRGELVVAIAGKDWSEKIQRF